MSSGPLHAPQRPEPSSRGSEDDLGDSQNQKCRAPAEATHASPTCERTAMPTGVSPMTSSTTPAASRTSPTPLPGGPLPRPPRVGAGAEDDDGDPGDQARSRRTPPKTTNGSTETARRANCGRGPGGRRMSSSLGFQPGSPGLRSGAHAAPPGGWRAAAPQRSSAMVPAGAATTPPTVHRRRRRPKPGEQRRVPPAGTAISRPPEVCGSNSASTRGSCWSTASAPPPAPRSARQQEVAVGAQAAGVHRLRDELEDAVVQRHVADLDDGAAAPLASSISPRCPSRPKPLTSVQACTPTVRHGGRPPPR